MTTTLSLGDVARLAGVSRPVVSMWRKRPKDGVAFPSPIEGGRFSAADIVDYLGRTRRGNNPDARRDFAVAAARSSHGAASADDLLVLLATAAVTGRSLADADPEELLDAVDALDPDDEWLFSELESVDIQQLATEADAVADAAWSAADAYESLLAYLRSRRRGVIEPGDTVVAWMASLARLLRSEQGAVVDAAGSAGDVVLAMAAHEDALDPPVVLAVASKGTRQARRRYAVHGIRPDLTHVGDDWGLPDGSVVLAAVHGDPDAAFDLLEEVAVQLGGATTALVVGPASVLVDELPGPLEARRDGFLRDPGRTLAAAVRLPQGLSRTAGREHLALWLLQAHAPSVTRIGDLGGQTPTPILWQQLLDDMLAVASGVRLRSFALLQRVPAATLLTTGRSLIDHEVAALEELVPSAGDDAARIRQLVDLLAAPLPDLFASRSLRVIGSRPTRHTSLGEAARSRQVAVLPGVRMEALPEGATPLWTAESLGTGTSTTVDLLALSTAHPNARLTEAGDVVFTSVGKPRAVVDAVGGGVVAYPARIIRVTPGRPLSPRAIAAAVNDLEHGNSKWRSWRIPLVQGDPADADGVLALVDALAESLRARQAQVDELRRLVVRAVLPGAVAFHETRPTTGKAIDGTHSHGVRTSGSDLGQGTQGHPVEGG